jgi:hypothetical protein
MEPKKLISIEDFRKRQREQRMALGIHQIDPERVQRAADKLSSRPINADPPEKGSLNYYLDKKEEKPKPSNSSSYGYFEMGGKRHENTGGGWKVLKPGQAARDKNVEREYQKKKKPGFVTGKPTL